MSIRVLPAVVVAASTLLAAACGSSTPSETPESASPAADAAHTSDHPAVKRVFFVQPKDGETIKGDGAIVEFGAEMFTIAAVPPGEVTSVRPETGHYHIAVDADCLPPGEIIPKADPWIHFGNGSNTAELGALTPGRHRLTVQAGDDQHRTLEGLCETITVTVAE